MILPSDLKSAFEKIRLDNLKEEQAKAASLDNEVLADNYNTTDIAL